MSAALANLSESVDAALGEVWDPEYPGISIVGLGLVEDVEISDGHVHIGLIPTFSGCPALAKISEDVAATVGIVPGVESVVVRWLRQPVWSIDRISPEARETMRSEFTVAVELGRGVATCPRCGAETREHSMFGPSRCRSVHHCASCSETVEVMRS